MEERPMILKHLLPQRLIFAFALIFSLPSVAQVTCGTAPNDFTITPTVLNDVTCPGGSDANLTVTVTGGVGPFTFQWVGSGSPPATQNWNNVPVGTYSVIVTDQGQGIACNESVMVGQPAILTDFGPMITNASCNGDCNGSILVFFSGGTPPYTYLWDDPLAQTASSATNLCAGDYTVIATDANGCTGSSLLTVTEPALLVATASGTNPSCNGGSDGSINISGSGGTGALEFSLDGVLYQPGSAFTALFPGNFTVYIRDANGCIATDNVTLTDPSILTASITASTDVTCFGGCDGAATVTASGGTPPYTYSWAPLAYTLPSPTGICAGTYTCAVTDNNGCTTNAIATINEPAQITCTFAVTDATCGAPNGSSCPTVAGGSGVYTYYWPHNGQVTACLLNAATGTYSLEVTDVNGCTEIFSTTINDIQAPTVSILFQNPTSCFGMCDGTVDLSVSGGVGPYTFFWNPGGQTTSALSNMCAGSYSCDVTGANGCINSFSVTIVDPAELAPSINSMDVTCFGVCDGSATLSFSGGVGPYNYQWVNSALLVIASGTTVTGLCPDAYMCTVTDSNGCDSTASFTIYEPGEMFTLPTIVDASSCSATDGSITFGSLGGSPPYVFSIDNGISYQVGGTFSNLPSGVYYLAVQDQNGCMGYSTDTIFPIQQAAGFTLPVGVLCATGLAVPSLSGGATSGTWTAQPAGLDINAGSGQIDLALSAPQQYWVYNTVAAIGGCSLSIDSFQVEVVALPVLTVTSTDALCDGACDGQAIVSVVGNGPFTYSWSEGSNTAAISGLCASSYDITVADVNGCTADSIGVVISQPTPIVLTSTLSQPSCGNCDGLLDVVATGGSGLFTYFWTPSAGLNDPTIANPTVCDQLFDVLHYVTVTDLNGCTALDSLQVISQCDSVFPGDTDYDGIANNNDLLPIGLAYGATGFVRAGATLNWTGQASANWGDTIIGATEYKHIDSDGNGTINDDDTLAIQQNYGFVHAIGTWNSRGGPNDPDLYFDITADTLQANTPFTFDLHLGTPSNPADNVYGLAYTVWFAQNTLDSASGIGMDFSPSWLGIVGADMITLQHIVWQQGRMDVGMVRIDGNSVSGSGIIGQLGAVTTDNLSGKSLKAIIAETLTLDITHVTIINELGETGYVNVSSDSVVVSQLDDAVNEIPSWTYNVRAYPVPADEQLIISTGTYVPDRVSIHDAAGAVVYQLQSEPENQFTVNLSDWPNGVYFVKIEVAGQVVNRKIVISH
jgi:hypothetical protein